MSALRSFVYRHTLVDLDPLTVAVIVGCLSVIAGAVLSLAV